MTDTATATATKENTIMSETAATEGKKSKTKKTKASNGLNKLASLPKGPIRSVQETFRCTPEEHNKLVEEAQKKGHTSMSDFYREKLGLDK